MSIVCVLHQGYTSCCLLVCFLVVRHRDRVCLVFISGRCGVCLLPRHTVPHVVTPTGIGTQEYPARCLVCTRFVYSTIRPQYITSFSDIPRHYLPRSSLELFWVEPNRNRSCQGYFRSCANRGLQISNTVAPPPPFSHTSRFVFFGLFVFATATVFHRDNNVSASLSSR